MKKPKMKDMPEKQRPYEKCVQLGAEALSDAELLAVILRTGSRRSNSLETAGQVLALNYPEDGLLGLCRLSLQELTQVEGIGTVKGIQLLCVGELSRRISRRYAQQEVSRYHTPAEASAYYMEALRHLEQEELHAMLLDTKQKLIRDVLISRGTVNASSASPREILIQALRFRAVSMILVHNHPSGDPAPSRDDVLLTRRVKEAGDLIGIQLLDHIVIGDGCYCRMKKEGML